MCTVRFHPSPQSRGLLPHVSPASTLPVQKPAGGCTTLNDAICRMMTSPSYLMPCKLLSPPQGLSDVTTASCSLGNQCGPPCTPPKVLTHSHCPIRGREGGRVLRREKTANQRLHDNPSPQ